MQITVFELVSKFGIATWPDQRRLAGRSLSLVLAGIISCGLSALAQTPGTFTATGSMIVPRAAHTATLLTNGKVLIAGGYQISSSASSALASAELYDPYTGAFAPTGDMTTGRAGHTATLLPDGRVLIAGGDGSGVGAELYDPSKGTFTATGSMVVAPAHTQTATLLGNGKVLIAGGYPTAELYDPATGLFSLTGAYAGSLTSPYFNTATLLPSGGVLITKCNCIARSEPLIDFYDAGTNSFSLTGPTSWTFGGENVNTATLLMNGKVLIAGDGVNNLAAAEAEVYDPSTGAVAAIGKTNAPHQYSTATLLPDGTVLIAGGQLPTRIDSNGDDFSGDGSPGVDLYAPATGLFYAVGNMTTGRLQHTATLLGNGTVLIAGGYSSWPAATSSAEVYRVPNTPTVQVVDNNTGSITALVAGDSATFQVTGALPFSLVSVSEAGGWSAPLGNTDASGSFRLSGTVGSNVVGTWQQTWTIGGVVAQPNPLQFTVIPKP